LPLPDGPLLSQFGGSATLTVGRARSRWTPRGVSASQLVRGLAKTFEVREQVSEAEALYREKPL